MEKPVQYWRAVAGPCFRLLIEAPPVVRQLETGVHTGSHVDLVADSEGSRVIPDASRKVRKLRPRLGMQYAGRKEEQKARVAHARKYAL